MAGREMANNKRRNPGGSYGREEELVAAGFLYSPKFAYDLMQNCDLPPPMKVYAGQDKTIGSPVNANYGTDYDDDKVVVLGRKEVGFNKDDNKYEDDKLELLKALRLSQTRAREAEKKAAVLTKEKNDLADFLLRQSMELFAYKQWVRLMEMEVGVSKKGRRIKEKSDTDEVNWVEIECNGGGQSMTWLVAVAAICMSIAGVGIFSFFSSSHYQP